MIVAALALSAGAIGIVLAIAAGRQTSVAPVAIAAAPAPAARSAECRSLLAALPEALGEFSRAAVAEPAPDGAAAWRDSRGRGGADPAEPVILRCGLQRPAEFVPGTPLQMVDDVGWLRLDDPDTRRSTWVCVDRPVYVALTLPGGSGPTPIQTLSATIAATMPAIPIRPRAAG